MATPLERFLRQLERLDRSRCRLEREFRAQRIVRRDIEAVYEGIYLRGITGFEAFLQELFYLILLSKAAPHRRISPLVTFGSMEVLENVILQNKKYVDWLPLDQTQERAKLYLRGGRPFTDIVKPQLVLIQKAVATRNAIAHSSGHAMARFKRDVIGKAKLYPRDRTPAGFLRVIARTEPDLTNYEIFMRELAQAAKDLAR